MIDARSGAITTFDPNIRPSQLGSHSRALGSGAAFSDGALIDIGEFAAARAALTVSRAGTDPPSRAELA